MEKNKAKGFLKSVATYKFIYVTYFVADVIIDLGILSRLFQEKNIDLASVLPKVEAVIQSIKGYISGNLGKYFTKFQAIMATVDITKDGVSQYFLLDQVKHRISYSEKQLVEAKSACEKFVNIVVENLKQRFDTCDDQANLLQAFSTLFDPTYYPEQDSEQFHDYGTVEVEMLQKHFHALKPLEAEAEYRSFKFFVKSHLFKVATNMADICRLLILKHGDTYPMLAFLAAVALTVPMSSVDCERGFSRQNLIKTRIRSALHPISLDRLLKMSIEGPPISEFDFDKAFEVWAGQKPRRILQVTS